MDLEKLIIGNGAGSIKLPDQVRRACNSAMTRITVGSITEKPRDGSLGEVYYFHPQEQWSLNSLGLPNPGIVAYRNSLPIMVKTAHDAGKELWASVAGFSPVEYANMTAACFQAGVDGVELNLSCPNVWSGSEHAQMPSLNPTLALEIISTVGAVAGVGRNIAVKISPTADADLLQHLADVIKASKIVSQVTACNTIPNQSGKRVDGKQALAFRSDENDKDVKNVGGLAGSGCIEANVHTVKYLRPLLPAEIKIIGCGGIFTGGDVRRYLSAGADGFQCTTSYLEYREPVFTDILMLLSDSAP